VTVSPPCVLAVSLVQSLRSRLCVTSANADLAVKITETADAGVLRRPEMDGNQEGAAANEWDAVQHVKANRALSPDERPPSSRAPSLPEWMS